MNIEIKKIPQSRMEIKVSLPWENWKSFIDKAAEEVSQDVKIKGFRPGKAPKNIVEQKVGKGAILEAAARRAINKTYPEAVKTEKIDGIGSPEIEILKLAEGNELEYKAITAVMPEMTIRAWQKEIQKINKNYQNEKIEVADEDVAKEIEKLAKGRVKLVTVNRAAQKGDSVEIDFQVIRGGAPIENGTSHNHPMVLGASAFIPGFEENIIGMKEQEEKEFELVFPEKYHAKDLAGKAAIFKVKVNLVQDRQLPAIDDAFVKSLGNFENLAALRNNIREGLAEEKKEKQKEKRKTDFLDKLIDLTKAELPEILVRVETRKMIEEFRSQIESMGMQLDDYLQKMKKKEEDLEKEWEKQAEKRVMASLILEQIAKDSELSVSGKDIEAEMNKILQNYKNIKDLEKNIDMERLYNYARGVLLNEKVFEYLENL